MSTSEPPRRFSASPARFYSKLTAALLLVSIVAGAFGEGFVPGQLIVYGDAAATAENLVSSDLLFRLGFASYLIEAVCDIALSLCFYVLLRPVSREVALLAAFFGLVSTAVFACAQLFFFTASFILTGADYLATFSPDQVNSLALLFINLHGYGGGLFMVFYGLASILRGILIFRSGYLPRLLGALLLLGGAGFVVRSFVLVLVPQYASGWFLLPTPIAIILLALWLLIKGIDSSRWQVRSRAAVAR